MDEYYEYEFDKNTKEFRDTFLGMTEQGFYLKTLNPIKYYTLARNKYLTHLYLENVGIPMPKLLGYHNPYKAGAKEEFAQLLIDLQNSGKCPFVIKATESSHGEGVYVVNGVTNTNQGTILNLINGNSVCLDDVLKYNDELIVESMIKQSKQLGEFNRTSVNTIRFMTCLYPNGEAKVIATFIKIGRNGAFVDNAGSGGNIDAGVDVDSGRLYNPVVFRGFRNVHKVEKHPDNMVQLDNVIIEDWENIKTAVIGFQKSLPFVKAAGWDIAITDNGPIVIEVNDSWDRTGQLFIQRGWRDEIRECFKQWENVGYEPTIERGTNNVSPSTMKKYQRLFK